MLRDYDPVHLICMFAGMDMASQISINRSYTRIIHEVIEWKL